MGGRARRPRKCGQSTLVFRVRARIDAICVLAKLSLSKLSTDHYRKADFMTVMTQNKKMFLIGAVLYGASYVFGSETVISDVLRVLGGITLLVTLVMVLREWSSRKKATPT